ncbi:hypothetical protein ABEB36_009271 [Hypothenemus hampei]|uniref:Triple QxxK/R motif-containing protein n=1 Tax=Hypothenemus hampei TaxID=57062 RepID=A0ABD1EHY2_HYPHA
MADQVRLRRKKGTGSFRDEQKKLKAAGKAYRTVKKILKPEILMPKERSSISKTVDLKTLTLWACFM